MSSKLKMNPIFKQYGRLHKEDLAREAAENNKADERLDDAHEAASAAAKDAPSKQPNGAGNENEVEEEDDFENIEAEIQRIKHEQASRAKPAASSATAGPTSKSDASKPQRTKAVTPAPKTAEADEFPDLEGCAPQLLSSSLTTIDNASALPPSRRPPGGAISTARIKEELNEGNISVSSSSDGDDEDEESMEDEAPNVREGTAAGVDSATLEGKSTGAPNNAPEPLRFNGPSSPLGNDDENSECVMAQASARPTFVRDPTAAPIGDEGEGHEEPNEADAQAKDDLITDASDVLSSFHFKEKAKNKNDRKSNSKLREAAAIEEDEWDDANYKLEEALDQQRSGSSVATQKLYPISFWEAVILLKRDKKSYQEFLTQPWMKRDTGTRTLPLHVPPQLPVYEKKKDIFSIFGCCGKSSSKDVATNNVPNGKGATPPEAVAPVISEDKEPDVPRNIADDANFLEAMKRCPFDHGNLTHRRILFTIYYTLTSTPGGSFVPSTGIITPWWMRREARKGSSTVLYTESTNVNAEPSSDSAIARHGTKPQDAPLPTDNIDWDRVGFQGTNPATDLRDSGIVALLTTLFLIDYYPLLMQKVWATCHPAPPPAETKTKKEKADLSRLPFVLIAFNFTAATLDALNLGMLRKAITRYDCDLTKDTPSSPVLIQSVVDLESEKTAASLSKIQAPVEALSTPAYCKPTPSEQRMRQRAPVLFTCCEYFVGIMGFFWETWLKKQKQKRPVLLTVADFGTEKALLRQRVAVSGKENGVFVATAKARYGALLNSFEDQINTV